MKKLVNSAVYPFKPLQFSKDGKLQQAHTLVYDDDSQEIVYKDVPTEDAFKIDDDQKEIVYYNPSDVSTS